MTVTARVTESNVSKFFDSYARDFDAIYGNRNTLLNRLINRFFRRSMRLRFEKTIQGCMPVAGKTVIDIGTGPGHYAITLAKAGAREVLGLDFAEGMVEIARENARRAGAADNCRFEFGDFLTRKFDQAFDYAILMGFMDYMADPRTVIDKAISITRNKAVFSFPVTGGFLAWQRKVRYSRRCDLFLYSEAQLRELFEGTAAADVSIERIARDFFVTATMNETCE